MTRAPATAAPAGLGLERLPDAADLGREMHDLMRELFPLCRSLTGDGVRETLARIGRRVPLEVTEVPSGTEVYDWTIPPEWNVREAWIADPSGRRVVDLADSSLHLMSYSVPVRARMSLDELRPHLHSLPERPALVPYRTSYWSRDWAFCLRHDVLESLEDGQYEVRVDSSLDDGGSLTYAECMLPGRRPEEILVSSWCCHPSLANDNLSGVVVAATLGRLLGELDRGFTYRVLLSPGSIGPLAWLSRHEDELGRIHSGLVVSAAGDPGHVTYKRSRREDAPVDRAAAVVLRDAGVEHEMRAWVPWGGDERQFCSPGFDLPMGTLTRTPAGEFPENHTSADDLDFVRPEHLAESLLRCLEILDALESDVTVRSRNPKGEPRLGKRGLYRSVGGTSASHVDELALLWVLNLADGRHSLLRMAERSGLALTRLRGAVAALSAAGLLEEAAEAGARGG
jgi:aminopeptidase-like protein